MCFRGVSRFVIARRRRVQHSKCAPETNGSCLFELRAHRRLALNSYSSRACRGPSVFSPKFLIFSPRVRRINSLTAALLREKIRQFKFETPKTRFRARDEKKVNRKHIPPTFTKSGETSKTAPCDDGDEAAGDKNKKPKKKQTTSELRFMHSGRYILETPPREKT